LDSVVTKFLGNNKDPDYITIVANMLEKFKVLNSHLEFFPENLGIVSEEQEECFQQYIKEMERRCQGWWN
jgi:hypothetical protein